MDALPTQENRRQVSAGRVGSFQLFMGMGTPRNIGIRWGMGASGQEQAEWDQVFDGEMKAGGAPCFVNLGSGRLPTQYFAVNDMSRGNATENFKTLL